VLLATLALLFADAVRAGGAATARGISDVTGEAFSFQMSPEQIEEANAASAEGIQRITDATRAGAAALLALLLADDLPTREVAEEWSGGLGLTKRQVASLDKFEEGLEETGLVTGDEKDSMVDKFALALLLDRAGVISDDQVWKAANIGREFALGTAVGIGDLSIPFWSEKTDRRGFCSSIQRTDHPVPTGSCSVRLQVLHYLAIGQYL
jgi:hypothetical protein